MNQSIDTQTRLFIQRAGIQNNAEELVPVFQKFFKEDAQDKHIILKRSILYFYRRHKIEHTLKCKTNGNDANVYTFDGSKVALLTPEYFMGSTRKALDDYESGFEIDFSNNNNNNNNNNGNNNG